jgi:hypothetical protein
MLHCRMDHSWHLQPGDVTTRAELVARYGGSVYTGGIVPSRTSNFVMVFSDVEEGAQFGYAEHDGVTDEGDGFDYTGAGAAGNQYFIRGNRTLLNHRDDDKRLQLFVSAGTRPGSSTKQQEYVGEYELRDDGRGPFRYDKALDKDKRERTVIVFQLRRISPGTSPRNVPRARPIDGEGTPFQVPIEADRTYVSARRAAADGTAHRREAALTSTFNSWLASHGRSATRWSIPIKSASSLLTDYFTADDSTLFEAKASSSRDDVRMAIGQLHDYRHNLGLDPLRCALLLPDEPAPDLIHLLGTIGFGCIVRADNEFHWLVEPRFLETREDRPSQDIRAVSLPSHD